MSVIKSSSFHTHTHKSLIVSSSKQLLAVYPENSLLCRSSCSVGSASCIFSPGPIWEELRATDKQQFRPGAGRIGQREDELKVPRIFSMEGDVKDQIGSVTQWCPTLCDPMNRSTPGLPVHQQLPEFTQMLNINRYNFMSSFLIWMTFILLYCLIALLEPFVQC